MYLPDQIPQLVETGMISSMEKIENQSNNKYGAGKKQGGDGGRNVYFLAKISFHNPCCVS